MSAFQSVLAGLFPEGRPIRNFLFLGPTGSGKTRSVEAVAEILSGRPDAVIKIDCAEFQHSHEISKLIGSPPGYIGHRETPAILRQTRLDEFHTAETGKEHKRHKTEHKKHKRWFRDRASCAFCASCVPFAFPWSKPQRSVVQRITSDQSGRGS